MGSYVIGPSATFFLEAGPLPVSPRASATRKEVRTARVPGVPTPTALGASPEVILLFAKVGLCACTVTALYRATWPKQHVVPRSRHTEPCPAGDTAVPVWPERHADTGLQLRASPVWVAPWVHVARGLSERRRVERLSRGCLMATFFWRCCRICPHRTPSSALCSRLQSPECS